MLQNGASKVFAIDVGYGQLAWKLRNDKRVVNIEKTNVRYFDPAGIEAVDFISVDVSFISLGLILPVASSMLKDEGELVCLIKPQFEAERSDVGKNGIIRDEKVHEKVIELRHLAQVLFYTFAMLRHLAQVLFCAFVMLRHLPDEYFLLAEVSEPFAVYFFAVSVKRGGAADARVRAHLRNSCSDTVYHA